MNSMIVLSIALAAVCGVAQASYGYASGWAGQPAHIQLSHDGQYVLDTPEVAHAKAAHLAAHAQVASQAGHGGWDGAWDGAGHASGAIAHIGGAGYGAPAAGLLKYGPAPLAHDGRVIDTPEVAHVKAAHLAAHAAAGHGALAHGLGALGGYAHGGYAHGGYAHVGAPIGYAAGYGGYQGPQAHIQLTHDGKYVADTPEVAHARAAHLAAHAHAAHAAAASPEEPWGHAGWAGGYAAPVAIGHDGYLQDTPAVAHARAQHLAAKASSGWH